MARVVAFVPDLMFGSRVQSMLVSAGHEVSLVFAADAARAQTAAADVLVVDLTAQPAVGVELLGGMRAAGELDGARTLAFYSHVEADTRAQALEAGFDLVVPRSRMAREGAELVAGLLAGRDA